jgi:poly-gamma-glutamate synthesis protein (capsule biosynthesis protein)
MRTTRALALAALFAAGGAGAASPSAAPPEPRGVVTAVGDVLLTNWQTESLYRWIARRLAWDPDAEYLYPFKNIRGELRGIVFGNLEGPLTDLPIREFDDKDEPYYFGVPSRFVRSLQLAGFRILSVANNHIRDCGAAGLLDTMRVLRSAGIRPVGAGLDDRAARAPVLAEDNGVRVAFLAYDLVPPASVWAGPKRPGAAHPAESGMVYDVRMAARRADAVIVSLHWGREIADESQMPLPSESRVALARRLVEAGATVVLGHHSHAVERIERYRRGVICYGLGNFVFAGTQQSGHPHSVIVRFTLGRTALPEVQVLPVLIAPDRAKWSPRPMTGAARAGFLARVGVDASGRLP